MNDDIILVSWQSSRTIRSKVRFKWSFSDELQITISQVEKAIKQELHRHFVVGSIISWNNNIKVRINDDVQKIQRIVNCLFRYNITDEAYGYVTIDLASSQLSQKPRVFFVWRFNILDREKIIEQILKDMISWIKEIY